MERELTKKAISNVISGVGTKEDNFIVARTNDVLFSELYLELEPDPEDKNFSYYKDRISKNWEGAKAASKKFDSIKYDETKDSRDRGAALMTGAMSGGGAGFMLSRNKLPARAKITLLQKEIKELGSTPSRLKELKSLKKKYKLQIAGSTVVGATVGLAAGAGVNKYFDNKLIKQGRAPNLKEYLKTPTSKRRVASGATTQLASRAGAVAGAVLGRKAGKALEKKVGHKLERKIEALEKKSPRTKEQELQLIRYKDSLKLRKSLVGGSATAAIGASGKFIGKRISKGLENKIERKGKEANKLIRP